MPFLFIVCGVPGGSARVGPCLTSSLGRENQVDAAILRNQLQSEIWNSEVLQSGKWDPQVYNGLAPLARRCSWPIG